MFSTDISFCMHKECPHDKCIRHYTHVPKQHIFSAFAPPVEVGWKCNYRFDEDWESVEEDD